MDPNRALADLIQALERTDDQTAIERANDLAEWLLKQGFMPDVKPRHLRILCAAIAQRTTALINRNGKR